MTIEIKQSTAVTFLLGPFVDATDGVTPETGLATAMDNAATGIRVSKNGAAQIDRNSATAPTHDDDGFYRVELSTTDTNTLGFLQVQYEELAVTLPGWKDFSVLTANAWDSKYSTDVLQVDVIEFVGTTVPTPAVTGVPDVNMTHHVDVAASVTNSELDVNVGQIIGTAPTLTSTNIDVNVAAMAPNTITPTAIAANAIDANALAADTGVTPLRANTATGGGASTITLDTGASALADFYNGAIIDLVNGTGAGQSRRITDYAVTTFIATVEPNWITNPVSGTEFVIRAGGNADLRTASQTTLDNRMAEASINTTGGAVDTVTTLTGHTAQTADHTAGIADIPTVSEFNARTILSADYFDPALDTVALVTDLTNLPSIPTNWLTAAGINADAVDKIRDGLLPTQNATFIDIPFLFVDSVDDVTPVTGATGITITRSLDGAAFGAVSGTTVTEIGNGMYHIDASAADMNAGKIVFRIAATGGTPNAPHDAFVTVITGGGV